MAVAALKKKLHHCIDDDTLPVLAKNQCLEKLDNISNEIKGRVKENLRYQFYFITNKIHKCNRISLSI